MLINELFSVFIPNSRQRDTVLVADTIYDRYRYNIQTTHNVIYRRYNCNTFVYTKLALTPYARALYKPVTFKYVR